VPTSIYHFTHVDNLEAILSGGALLCLNQNPNFLVSAAYQDLQGRRSRKKVLCEPWGTLHDYVPFYFAPRSPMMFALSRGSVPTFQGNIYELVYLVSSVERIQELGHLFVFTDGHALMALSGFYNDAVDLNKLDWQVIKESIWKNTDEDNDRERRRQAEFLIKTQIDLAAINEIGVYSPTLAKRTAELIKKHQVQIAVSVRKNWYY
jgi:hypothetical protein